MTPSLEEVDDRQQDDGSEQRDQHGWNGESIIDRSDVKDGAEEVTSDERAYDGDNDIDQQVRAVMHDFRRDPADHCSNDKVYKKVHFYLLSECLSCAEYRAFLLIHT